MPDGRGGPRVMQTQMAALWYGITREGYTAQCQVPGAQSQCPFPRQYPPGYGLRSFSNQLSP
jgi:hypothetical protein